ncbi:MAG: hypothetical protein ACUVXE_11240, partial [Anaerolineae bacterium]
MHSFSHTLIRFTAALLKHQARRWLGEEALGIAAETLLDEQVQARLDAWLTQAETQQRLLQAAETAQAWLQDPANCPDAHLRALFRDLPFGDLPSVQTALAELPGAPDTAQLEGALTDALARDLPTLAPEKRAQAARLLTEALLRAVGTLKEFTLPVILQVVLRIQGEQRAEFATLNAKVDDILRALQQGRTPSDLTALQQAERLGLVSIQGDVKKSIIIIGSNNTVTLNASQTEALRDVLTLPGDLPPGSSLPFPRNAAFTGREGPLEQLAQGLCREDGAPGGMLIGQAVQGMGGVGKTQLAVEFAYRYGYRFRGVHWLDLRDPALLNGQIARYGEAMGLPHVEGEDLSDYARRVVETWKRDGPRLLLLDNFEQVEVAARVLGDLQLQHSSLRLLVTSRRADWPPTLPLAALPLETFSPAESRAFLRRFLPPERATDDELEALAERLGRLPLALELAARYLTRRARLSVAEYLAELGRALEHPSLRGYPRGWPSPTGHDLNLWATFDLSWEQVREERARQMFLACGYLAPSTLIPPELLDAALGAEAGATDEALSDLLGLGLLQGTAQQPIMHPLLAEFARQQDAGAEMLRAMLPALADLAVETTAEVDRTADYARFARLAPHLRALAEHGDSLLPEEAEPGVRA